MFEQSRRALICSGIGLASLCVSRPGLARIAEPAEEVLPLWPGTPPGGANIKLSQIVEDGSNHTGYRNRRLSGIGTPVLVVKRAPQPNGSAIIVIPGGGYSLLNYDAGGTEQAQWLNALGVTTFILIYRLPGEGWARRADVPLQDAQRAIRLIRANSSRFGVDQNRVGVLGSSAGGHLAGSLATRFNDAVYDPVDSFDEVSARPDLAALLFPVVTMGQGAHASSREKLLGPDSSVAMQNAYSLEKHVPTDTPPMFLCAAGDDQVVPPVNSLNLYRAMLEESLKAELHIFQKGGHGFGVRLPKSVPASHWPELFIRFARYNGLLA